MNHSTLVVCWAWCTRSYDDEHHPYRDRDGRPIARSCSQSRRSGGPGSRPHRVQQPPSSLRRLHDDLPWLLDLRPARSLVARPGRPHLPGYPGGSHSIPTTRAPTQRRNCTTTSARGTTSPWTLPSTDGAAAWPLRHDCATPSPLLCMTTR